MTEEEIDFNVMVTFNEDGQLVYADSGEPVPPTPPRRVCENTLNLIYGQERRTRMIINEVQAQQRLRRSSDDPDDVDVRLVFWDPKRPPGSVDVRSLFGPVTGEQVSRYVRAAAAQAETEMFERAVRAWQDEHPILMEQWRKEYLHD